jgi:two-component system LytT family response regulator
MLAANQTQFTVMTALANKPESATRKIRALIVDDQAIQREVLRCMLRNETDIEIVGTPHNGREAVNSIKELNPDLVFMDVLMPELDGFGVVSEIGAKQMPPVIFITANEEFAQKASEVNALDYLLKPCTRDRFQAALKRARTSFQSRISNVD